MTTHQHAIYRRGVLLARVNSPERSADTVRQQLILSGDYPPDIFVQRTRAVAFCKAAGAV